jgi:hypothetical protein
MAWERRKRGGLYYTRSYRVHGRVQREYVGTGELALLCAELDARISEERQLERACAAEDRREALAAYQARFASLLERIERRHALTQAMVQITLEAAGFHQHARGEWRHKRGTQAHR